MLNYNALSRTRAALMVACLLVGCATTPDHDWPSRLHGDAIVLLGEVHDNSSHHWLRYDVLRRAFAAGWRPAIAMEQFDRERQADIDRARAERPLDANHVIALAAPPTGTAGGNWRWDDYRPLVMLALEYNVPLLAANLAAADTRRIARDGYAAVFNSGMLRELRLDRDVPRELQSLQEREIDEGHCKTLPANLLPGMVRAQMARDAVMAQIIAQHAAARGVVLIAGNGHVRRDIGVPHWLGDELRSRTLAVAYLETGHPPPPAGAYNVAVLTAPAPRVDPCLALRQRNKK